MKENDFYRYFESLNEIERIKILNRLTLINKILTSDIKSGNKELMLKCLYLNKEHTQLILDELTRINDSTI